MRSGTEKTEIGPSGGPRKSRLSDQRFRAVLFACGSMGWNLLYGIYNGILGIVYRSVWFLTMCAFYLILGLMRLSVVTSCRKGGRNRTERSVMRHNGIALIFLAAVLSGSVVLAFLYPVGKASHRIVMISIAAYTFYLVVLSAVNFVKAHRAHSLFLISLRNLSLAGAISSLVSLERSMLATFGTSPSHSSSVAEVITGIGASLLVVALGITMIVQGRETCG